LASAAVIAPPGAFEVNFDGFDDASLSPRAPPQLEATVPHRPTVPTASSSAEPRPSACGAVAGGSVAGRCNSRRASPSVAPNGVATPPPMPSQAVTDVADGAASASPGVLGSAAVDSAGTPTAVAGEGSLLASSGRELVRSQGMVVSIVVCGPVEASSATVALCYANDAAEPLDELRAEVALPKFLKMELSAPSGTSLPAEPLPGFGPTLPPLTQMLRLIQQVDPPKPLKIKLKVSFTRGGDRVTVGPLTVGPEFFEAST